jgi:hypothetical protein
VGIALALALTAYFAYFLRGFSYLPGTDAYYYALQAQSLLDTGHLKVPDRGAIHYAVAALAGRGLSIEAAFRLMLIAIFALYQMGMALVFIRLKPPALPMVALLWTLASPVIAFHTIEFPALALALAPLPLWFWLAMETTLRRLPALAWLLAASLLVHPAAAAFVLVFAVTLAAGRVQRWRSLAGPPRFAVLALCGVGCLVCSIVIARRFTGLELRLWSLHAGMPGMLSLAASADVPSEITFTILTLWALLSLSLVSFWKIYPRRWLFLSLAALALPLWPDRSSGLGSVGGRLGLMFVLLALPLLAVGVNELTQSPGFPAWTSNRWTKRFAALAAVMVTAILPVRLQSSGKLLMIDDYFAYERVVTALRDVPIPILIAHRGLDFFYSYRLRRDAFHFDPEPDWNRAEIWRAAARVTPEELAFYSPQGCAWGRTARTIRGTQYLLVREDCWEKFRSRIDRSQNPDLYAEIRENMENPSQARPAFLRARQRLPAFPTSAPASR